MIKIEKNTESGYAEKLNSLEGKNIKVSVECDQTNFLNLQYLFLWLQKNNSKCTLEITPTDKSADTQGDRFRISSFLSASNINSRIINHMTVFSEDFQYRGLQSVDDKSLQKVLPLLNIDFKAYNFLSGTVVDRLAHTIYNNEHFSVVGKGKKYSFSNFDSNHTFGDSAEVVLKACGDYLFHNRQMGDQLFSERLKYFRSPQFYEKVHSLSVLAFLIFCAYDNTLATNEKRIKDFEQRERDIDAIIMNVLDMSDGLLQLIENVVFHAKRDGKDYGQGLLSFRIHQNGDGESSDTSYLKKQYPEYFNGGDNRYEYIDNREVNSNKLLTYYENNPPANLNSKRRYDQIWEDRNKRKQARMDTSYYLEIRLFDYSGKDICATFLESIKGKNYEDAFPKNIRLQAFFNPIQKQRTAIWDRFYKDPDNAVHHYGLQLFEALLKGNDGCFIAQSCSDTVLTSKKRCIFTTSGDSFVNKNEPIFPGTQYAILIPFRTERENNPSFVNTTINYSLSEQQRKYTVKSDNDPQTQLANYMNSLISLGAFKTQQEKTNCIDRLYCILKKYKPGVDDIIMFNAEKLNLYNMEVFAKSLMLYICNNRDLTFNFAINNCNPTHFIKLARLFAVFYDRNGDNSYMEKVQIYLVGKDSKDEFLISGTNLKATLVAQVKLSAARGISGGIPSKITQQLIQMLSRFPGKGTDSSLDFVPFDLLIKNESGLSVFEQNALDVLNSDIQGNRSGCKISPNHMRVGSKIHIDAFYEAETLFYNNYYTTRYAYLLAQFIKDEIKKPDNDERLPFLIIGYETYSEMLLRELCKFFEGMADYCIFEYGTTNKDGEKAKDKFRYAENISTQKMYKPIYVVPINSTLSTFNKLEAQFAEEFIKNSKNPVSLSDNPLYLGVVQVRGGGNDNTLTEAERPFFGGINVKDRVINSKLLQGKDVHYINLLFCRWENPLRCSQCYPTEYINEVPIVETDKSSVIPAQLFGKHSKKTNHNFESTDRKKVEGLKPHVLYGHVFRGSNHFSYYVKTDCYFHANRPDVEDWLKDTVKKAVYSSSKNVIRYDIIISPVHFSNNSFVKSVNDKVFNGASLVIGVDSGKEFRDNFIAKHSDLKSLYQNLCEMGSPAEINFYFVDDTITHGGTFLRVRSLLYSLFPDYEFSSEVNNLVKVNIFRSIIVLLNRLSGDSKKNFILDKNNFFHYFTLNISSLRTHDNACVMCKESADLEMLSKSCSHEHLASRFHNKHIDVSVQDFNKFEQKESAERGYWRLLHSHEMQSTLKSLEDINDKKQVFAAIVKKIYSEAKAEKSDSKRTDPLIASITVTATPFLSFRKSTHEAVFDVIIILFETVLSSNDPNTKGTDVIKRLKDSVNKDKADLLGVRELTSLVNLVLKLSTNRKNQCDLVKALIKISVSLKSSYIIRAENIARILSLAKNYFEKGEYTFTDYYLYYIKKLLTLGTDEAKSAFLEYLLLSGVEYPSKKLPNIPVTDNIGKNFYNKNKFFKNVFQSISEDDAIRFTEALYLENTKILHDAALDLLKNDGQSDIYFLDNFNSVLQWNNIGSEKQEIINALRDIQLKLEEHTSDIKDYYCELSEMIAVLLTCFAKEKDQTYKEVKPDIYFLAEVEESVLVLESWHPGSENIQTSFDDTNYNIVKSITKKTMQCFANSKINKKARPNFEALMAKNVSKSKKILTDTYEILESEAGTDQRYQIISFSSNGNGINNNPPIYILIRYPSVLNNFEILRAFRSIIMFRDAISVKIKEHFNSNLLQQELKTTETQRQLRKARSAYHADFDDLYNPEQLAAERFLGNVPEDFEYYGYKEAVYTFLINTIIGRLNTKVIPPHDDVNGRHDTKLNSLSMNLASIANISRYKNLTFVDKADQVIENEKLKVYFDDLFSGREFMRNDSGVMPYHTYVTAFIAELVSSAVRYGKKESGKVRVGLELDDEGYFWVCNRVTSNFDVKKVEISLARKGTGISLPTISSYFELFYQHRDAKTDDRCHVRIKLPKPNGLDNIIKIGLPLFIKKGERR